MAATSTNDRLPNTGDQGFSAGWDYKSSYVSTLAEDGLERFGQFSATPDTTLLYAGPARFSGLSGDAAQLIPIGLADGITVSQSAATARLFELGSNRSFFTRGKTATGLSLGRMLSDTRSLLAVLTANSYKPNYNNSSAGGADPNPNIQLNLDSEIFGVPFGLMMLMKTRGGGTDGSGKILTAVYFEYCVLGNHSFSIASASPVVVEQVSMECDRVLPIALN